MNSKKMLVDDTIMLVLVWIDYMFQGVTLMGAIGITVIIISIYLFGIWLTNWLK